MHPVKTSRARRNVDQNEDAEPQQQQPQPQEENIEGIQESISNMRDEYVDRHHSEPEVNLRYGRRGVDSSTISMRRGESPEEEEEDESEEPLPGPSQVVTHPGNSSIDPATGQRLRRRGVSGPPTGSCLSTLTFTHSYSVTFAMDSS